VLAAISGISPTNMERSGMSFGAKATWQTVVIKK